MRTMERDPIREHARWKGKIEVIARPPLETKEDLTVAYTPGVAKPCLEIRDEPEKSWLYTRRSNLVAVITDGTAVLGLGDIGPEASMPVMEGKCALFKRFADVDAFPICVDTKDPKEFVDTVSRIALSFGGINLEDISAPRCFEIEPELQKRCPIPVFHDDQHGTAVVVLSAFLNALKVVGKKPEEVRVVGCGAGAAGISIARLLLSQGVGDYILCDRIGAICEGMEGLNPVQEEMSRITNRSRIRGSLADAVKGADVFIGTSAPGVLTGDMVRTMAKDPVIFACANPTPEIFPDEAKAAGARIVSTGRSDHPNQVNNLLCFPGIFRGALDVRASEINTAMQLAAAHALAALIPPEELSEENIIASPLDPRVVPAVADAVRRAARESGVSRI